MTRRRHDDATAARRDDGTQDGGTTGKRHRSRPNIRRDICTATQRPGRVTLTMTPQNGYSFLFNGIALSSDTPLSSGRLEIDIEGAGHSYWSLVVQTPDASIPQVGLYTDATRWPFENAGTAGMDLNSNGRGENQLSGWFNILELCQTDGTITALAIDFYQQGTDYGAGRTPSEFGSIRYNSDIAISPVPEPRTSAILGFGCACLIGSIRSRKK